MKRKIEQLINGMPASDGEGVRLTRIIGSPYLNMLDPFLLFDAFGSDKPQDYIGGFPSHPHRGFETVTYMLDGKMRHQDSVGNAGVIESGDVQWMTAGKGIIHSEMPEQEDGLLAGFQLWVNLPASHKMIEPFYQEKKSADIASEKMDNGVQIKVIAGKTAAGTEGVIKNSYVNPIYWDIQQPADSEFQQPVTEQHNVFVYLIEGQLTIDSQTINPGQLAVLTKGEEIQIAAKTDSRYLIIGGQPLNEPVARSGPFVMNSREEINQAYSDYQTGNFA